MAKSEKKIEFLFSCLYSKDDINVSVSNQIGVKVRSLFSEMTLKCLKENVPDEVPGIVFLSGGQSNELATAHLNEMNKVKNDYKWNLSFSYGRALQQSALKTWLGKDENLKAAQHAFGHRALMNKNAALGAWNQSQEG